MDRQRIQGGLQKTTGVIKKKVGQVSGTPRLENVGRIEKNKADIRSGVGKAMDAVREVVNNEKD